MAILAYPNPIYQPAMRIISNITKSNPAIVTTTFDHLYITGTIVRIDMPLKYGMQQINGMTGEIVVTAPTTFAISINSLFFDAYSIPSDPQQYPQVVPIGENNSILTAAVQNTLPH